MTWWLSPTIVVNILLIMVNNGYYIIITWLMMEWVRQLGWFVHSQLNGKINNVPNHQPVILDIYIYNWFGRWSWYDLILDITWYNWFARSDMREMSTEDEVKYDSYVGYSFWETISTSYWCFMWDITFLGGSWDVRWCEIMDSLMNSSLIFNRGF